VTCYLGIDSSTTATKALLMGADGEVVGVASSEYTYDTPRPMWTEQHPDLWWQATVTSIRQVLSASDVDPGDVQGLGLTGQMYGLVRLDRDGAVLRPAILWNAQRPGAPDPAAQGLRAVQADGQVRHRQGRGCGHPAVRHPRAGLVTGGRRGLGDRPCVADSHIRGHRRDGARNPPGGRGDGPEGRHARDVLFLPYLTGERTLHPDPLPRGAFVGLTVRHTQPHLTRAVLEGLAFGLRDSFELMKEAGLADITQVRVTGGGARSPLWRQILAQNASKRLLGRSGRRAIVVGQVKGPAHHSPRVLIRVHPAEIVPQPERNSGQLEAGAAAAIVSHGLVPVVRGKSVHAYPSTCTLIRRARSGKRSAP
jgi:hypothetical protein